MILSLGHVATLLTSQTRLRTPPKHRRQSSQRRIPCTVCMPNPHPHPSTFTHRCLQPPTMGTFSVNQECPTSLLAMDTPEPLSHETHHHPVDASPCHHSLPPQSIPSGVPSSTTSQISHFTQWLFKEGQQAFRALCIPSLSS